MDDFYYTIAQSSKVETKVKSSRFIAESFRVESAENAGVFLKDIRKREHAATHHCYAYMIFAGQEFKYSDDGEPSGTAGKPIFDCISGRGLSNVMVVVTRYYGGTKLGTGGLVRAYSNAASEVLDKSERTEIYITDSLSIELEFKYFDQIQKLCQRYECVTINSNFGELVKLTLSVRKSLTEKLRNEIINLTHGQAKITKA